MKIICEECGCDFSFELHDVVGLVNFHKLHKGCRELQKAKREHGARIAEIRAAAKQPDPYQRFRDAIKDGKRVFWQATGSLSAGHMLEMGHDDFHYPRFAEDMFVEGQDIPMQPTQEWLDRNGVELTGECRVPAANEKFAGRDPSFGVCCNSSQTGEFSGRRWIVRPKANKEPELVRCLIKDRGNGKLECCHYNGGLFDAHDAPRYINFAGYEYEVGHILVTPWRKSLKQVNELERAKYVLFRRNT